MAVPELVARFVLPLEAVGVRYMITGSVAAIGYGEPRLTNDVDLVVELRPPQIGRMLRAYEADEALYVPPADVVRDTLRQGAGASFNVVLPARALKADFFPVADDLARWGLDHRRRERVADAEVWVAPPEYVIVRKLQYLRMGGSAKHVEDIRSMLRFSADRIDLAQVEALAAPLGLAGEWRAARAGAERAGLGLPPHGGSW